MQDRIVDTVAIGVKESGVVMAAMAALERRANKGEQSTAYLQQFHDLPVSAFRASKAPFEDLGEANDAILWTQASLSARLPSTGWLDVDR